MTRFSRCAVFACFLAILAASGCATSAGAKGHPLVWTNPHAATETFAEAPDDHYNRVSRILEHDRLGLTEDLDLLFMTEKSSRLSRWHGQ